MGSAEAQPPVVSSGILTAPFFLATKLEAFAGRGAHDYYASRDLEDVIAVIDGRPNLPDEVHAAPADVRAFLRRELKALLNDPDFVGAVPGHLPPDAAAQSRVLVLLERIRALLQ